jgi:hypothetical protein
VELSHGADSDATGEGGNCPSCTELCAHRGRLGNEVLDVIRQHGRELANAE